MLKFLGRLLRRKPKQPFFRDIVIEVFEHGGKRWRVESYNSHVTEAEAERRAWETLEWNRDKYDRVRLVDEQTGAVLNEMVFGKGGRSGHRDDSGGR